MVSLFGVLAQCAPDLLAEVATSCPACAEPGAAITIWRALDGGLRWDGGRRRAGYSSERPQPGRRDQPPPAGAGGKPASGTSGGRTQQFRGTRSPNSLNQGASGRQFP